MSDPNWRDVVKLAEHYDAIGHTDIFLSDKKSEDYPWEFCTGVEPGSTYRLDCVTSISFRAEHPCGLSFRWYVDLEDRDANGKSHFSIDTARLSRTMTRLPEKARPSLAKYLLDSADKVEARAKEYQDAAIQQFGGAQVLRNLAKSK